MKSSYIFIADGELKVFLSELIAKQFCADGDHHLVTFTPRIQETWDLYDWKTKTCLPWVHRQGLIKKYWNLRERIYHILKSVGDLCEGADQIVVHTYQIYSERTNYLIHYLQNRYPNATVRFRLLPDGVLNLTKRVMDPFRRLAQTVNRIKWTGDSIIQPYAYKGDRLGADADIVDRIYLPRNFPNQYDEDRIHWIDMPRPLLADGSSPSKSALVIGTAMTQTKVCTRGDVDQIAARIQQQLKEMGYDEVYYKPHHKEKEGEFELWSPGYEILETKKGIERLLLQSHYDVLIGLCSTALLTSKLMYSDLNVISCGLDIVEKRARKGASVHLYRGVCQDLGIPLV